MEGQHTIHINPLCLELNWCQDSSLMSERIAFKGILVNKDSSQEVKHAVQQC
jgi:hypothetical protein